jgi:secondary thiamine-phosphate synthase enzyme
LPALLNNNIFSKCLALKKLFTMKVFQKEITLSHHPRGFHLITKELLSHFPEIKKISSGCLNVFIKHTSASLTINENADPTVRKDFETHFNRMIPDGAPHFEHRSEGPDDMPAHIKSSLLGASVNVPVTNGSLNLGTWQGIYLCEHRNHGGSRDIVLTAFGISSG